MRSDKYIRQISFLPLVMLIFFFGNMSAQVDKEQLKIEKETQKYLSEANGELADDDFVDAEVNYRKAIALSPSEEVGKYNLGNAYYNEAKNREAMQRYAQAAEVSTSKPEKHRAYHNLGNTFMNDEKYQEAVEAYKSALRSSPTDDETRYNLALAKDMLEKNPPQGGDGEDENEDQKENDDNKEDQEENQDSKDDEGKEKEGDEGDQKEDEGEGDEKKEQNEGEDEEKEGKPNEPKDQKDGQGDEPKQQQNKPVPGQLSPQQIKNLLEAMNNEEKKVQDKINAKKLKGPKVKSNKDW